MLTKEIFEFESLDGVGDRIIVNMKGDCAYFTIESDWCGDTESGFGQECSIDVTKESAIQLAEKIIRWAKE